MIASIRQRLREAARAIAPLLGVAVVLQLTLVQAPLAQFAQFLLGSLLVVVGMALLFVGIDMGILPMGRFVGAELPRRRSLWLIVAVAFALGFATTIAEPDVLILAQQVQAASAGAMSARALGYLIAAGVGLFAAVALLRIVFGLPYKVLLGLAYATMLALSWWAPAGIVPLAFDAGSVTTGVLSAPVLLALAIGLASVLAGRSTGTDGFGLLEFASVGPVVLLLLLGLWQA